MRATFRVARLIADFWVARRTLQTDRDARHACSRFFYLAPSQQAQADRKLTKHSIQKLIGQLLLSHIPVCPCSLVVVCWCVWCVIVCVVVVSCWVFLSRVPTWRLPANGHAADLVSEGE